jgi:hypothetical protein
MRYFFILSLILFSFSSPEPQVDKDNLDTIVNNWHLSASNADFDSYFELMNDKFIFLGTAPGERWTKEEFAKFSKPYFDKGKAWDFKVIDRSWVFSKNKKMAWFDENLDTWMKDCRGSGIMVYEGGQWKLAYYNLTVLIENEKIQEFIELREK